ncbi:MAG: hypothetical protein IAE82_09170 [Opitutaceae bacterium]|nr:hypothetical protein [Opitutaceae bacterium]
MESTDRSSFAVSSLRTAALSLALAVPAFAASAAAPLVPDGWFLWPAVEPADGSALDTGALNATPAGAHGRVAVREGVFVDGQGERLRFWGANLCAAESFPSAEDAELIARRLAKGGVNIARLHHLDNTWSIGEGGTLWSADHKTRDTFDPDQLDRLHRLVATLARHGIYSNINLKVSKSLTPADGFADTIGQLPEFQKRVDIYQRRMVELQKDYARRLLTAKNPYTGLSLAEDPAVAVVEINNENSLLGYWTRDLGRGLDRFPEPFRGELVAQWNAWLARRYGDDEALRASWHEPPVGGAVSLVQPKASWRHKVQPGAAARLKPGRDATSFEVRVERTTGISHHVQASLHGLALEEGRVYTLEFEARADRERPLQVVVSIDGEARPGAEWRSFGLLETVTIGRAWAPVRVAFPAHSIAGDPASLAFNLAGAIGRVSVRGVRLVAGCEGSGLLAGQSPRAGTVPIPTSPSARQWADWIHFLADTERAFADEMRAYLRDELGVRAPMECSQIDYGGLVGLWREQAMEYADAHAYWQHPDFAAGLGWDPARWTIKNSPQVAELRDRAFAGFGTLAFVRVAGKPFSVSEYDHPAPSDYACEMYATLASFAARQDWDALYPFAVAEYGSRNPGNALRGFFDQVQHPAKWAFAPFATRVFRLGLVARASSQATLHLAAPVWTEQPHADLLWRKLLPPGRIHFLDQRLGVSDRPAPGAAQARLDVSGAVEPGAVALVAGSRGQVYLVAAPAAAAVVGPIGGTEIRAGALQVACAEFGRGFAAITAVALDDLELAQSRRVLITLGARGENLDMSWNAERTSVGAAWGSGPTIAERVPATIVLAGDMARSVYALAPDGTRARRVDVSRVAGGLRFAVSPGDATMHYEVVAE